MKKESMIDGRIGRSILLFALPIMGGLFLQMLYSTVDGIVVGNFVDEVALGAVNISGAYVNLLVAVANGISAGSGVYLAQLYGANEKEKLHKAMATLHILMIVSSVVLTILSLTFAPAILGGILNVPSGSVPVASLYLRIYVVGLPMMFLYNGMAAALRSIGDSSSTMFMLIISSIVNIILDLLFVAVFRMGVSGAALATVISQLIVVVTCAIYIMKKQPLLHISRNEFTFDMPTFQIFLKAGIPLAIQYVISQLGALAVQRLVNSYEESFMASVAAASRIEQFAVVPIMSFAQALVVFSGQNTGAGKLDRTKKGLFASWKMSLSGCVVLAFVFIFGAEPLIYLFGCRGNTLAIGVEYLHFVPVSLVFAAFQFTTRCALQGAGDIKASMVVTFISLGMRIISAYAMAATVIGYRAVWICTAVDFFIGAVFNIIRFSTGKWKKKALI